MVKEKDKEYIALRVHAVAKGKLDGVPFDKGLPVLRGVLWELADEYGVQGADIFTIYMDWMSAQTK